MYIYTCIILCIYMCVYVTLSPFPLLPLSLPPSFPLSLSLPPSFPLSLPPSLPPHLSPISGERPTLPELLRLKIPQSVGVNYSIFGIFLLNDETGVRVRAFKKECQGDAEDVMLRILQEWLEGKGVSVSWQSLIQALRDTGLSELADHIQALKL